MGPKRRGRECDAQPARAVARGPAFVAPWLSDLERRLEAAGQYKILGVLEGRVTLPGIAGCTRKEPQDQPVARHPVGNAGEDQVELVQRLAREEELCDQSRAEAGSEERKMDVRRPPPSRLSAGLALRDRIPPRPAR